MRSIIRRDTGASYNEFLTGLAQASGIRTPTREYLTRLDRKRKKRTSNKEWKSPIDEDARVAKMKDGRNKTLHLARTREHSEASADPRRRIQPQSGAAEHVGSGHSTGAE
jgi:transposase